jgi:hypothetical protein
VVDLADIWAGQDIAIQSAGDMNADVSKAVVWEVSGAFHQGEAVDRDDRVVVRDSVPRT